MLNAVRAINYRGEEVSMELRRPEKSGFVVSEITGIGAPKSDIGITDLATLDGGFYNSARANTRNIVFNVIFLDDPANDVLIEDTRHKSYQFFPVKKPVKLIFETDRRLCEITGYVENNEPTIFSKQEASQISIICPFPFFYDASGDGYRETRFSYVIPLFEFVYENDSYSIFEQEERATEFGAIVDEHEANIIYYGDAEIGFICTISLDGRVINPGIYNAETGEEMNLNTERIESIIGSELQKGDEIIINTVRGEKSVYHVRAGVYTNILNGLDRFSDWLLLQKGDNIIGFRADGGTENMTVTIKNRTLYEGV